MKRMGDEGMPFVPAGRRKAGMGDEGLPLKKGPVGFGDEGRPIKAAKKKTAKKTPKRMKSAITTCS